MLKAARVLPHFVVSYATIEKRYMELHIQITLRCFRLLQRSPLVPRPLKEKKPSDPDPEQYGVQGLGSIPACGRRPTALVSKPSCLTMPGRYLLNHRL